MMMMMMMMVMIALDSSASQATKFMKKQKINMKIVLE